ARNMLGDRERFDDVPFFWSQHYDVTIRYVGHAEKWDEITIDGSLDARDATVSYMRNGTRLAVATTHRDRESPRAEVELERVLRFGTLLPFVRIALGARQAVRSTSGGGPFDLGIMKLNIAIVDAHPSPHAAAPGITFRLRIEEATGRRIHALAL